MFDATTLLGAMLGGGFGRRSSLTKVAATAAGVAAVGGLGYMAYRHFQGAPGAAAPPAQAGWGQPAQGAAWGAPAAQPAGGAPAWGAPPAGAPATPAWGGAQPPAPAGPGGALGAAGGMIAGFTSGLVGQSGGLRTDGFASSGYGWQAPPDAAAPAAPAPPPPAATAPAATAPATPDQATSLLLVRAMVAAAFADGTIDATERAELLARLEQAGLGPDERTALTAELDAPKPVTLLVTEVTSPAVAEQFYLVSLLSMQIDTDAERSYARMLPGLLGLSPDAVRGIHERAGLPPIA